MIHTEMQFDRGLPSHKPFDEVTIPFVRFTKDWLHNPPYFRPPFKTLWDKSAEMTEQMAEEALEALMCSFPGRTRLGQSSQALLDSGLSAAVLRAPEVETGSFVSVSL